MQVLSLAKGNGINTIALGELLHKTTGLLNSPTPTAASSSVKSVEPGQWRRVSSINQPDNGDGSGWCRSTRSSLR